MLSVSRVIIAKQVVPWPIVLIIPSTLSPLNDEARDCSAKISRTLDGEPFPGSLIGGIEIRKRVGNSDAFTVNERVVGGATRSVVYTNGEIRALNPAWTIFSRSEEISTDSWPLWKISFRLLS